MASKKSKKAPAAVDTKFLKGRLAKVNKVLGRLEGEVEKALSRFMKRGEKSSQVIRKNFDEIFEKISTSDLYSRANEKREELVKELKGLTEDLVSKVKNFDLRVAKPLLDEIRSSFEEVIGKLQNSGFVEQAKLRLVQTRNQLLNVLSIPTQRDVDSLSQKISRLEKKINTITDKAA